MANRIQMRRGLNEQLPALASGEPGFCTNTGEFFIGSPTGNKQIGGGTEGFAPLASPALTGTPTAPTADQSVNNTQLATTAFVKTAVGAAGSGLTQADVRATPLTGLASNTGELAATDTILQAFGKAMGRINQRAPLASPAFTGFPTAPTPEQGSNDTQLATTEFVNTAAAGVARRGIIRVDHDLADRLSNGMHYYDDTFCSFLRAYADYEGYNGSDLFAWNFVLDSAYQNFVDLPSLPAPGENAVYIQYTCIGNLGEQNLYDGILTCRQEGYNDMWLGYGGGGDEIVWSATPRIQTGSADASGQGQIEVVCAFPPKFFALSITIGTGGAAHWVEGADRISGFTDSGQFFGSEITQAHNVLTMWNFFSNEFGGHGTFNWTAIG